MKTFLAPFLALLVLVVACMAQDGPRGPSQFLHDWKQTRDKQPVGVGLKLNLSRTHYYLGEVIPGTLYFSNTMAKHYDFRIKQSVLLGEGKGGVPVLDPLAYYHQHFFEFNRGLEGDERYAGDSSISLAANQWLQFDQPGTYTIYARSILEGEEQKGPGGPEWPTVTLVTDPIEITIEPLSPEKEKEVIEQALEVLSRPMPLGSDTPAFEAIERLRYLRTPASLEALLPFVDSSNAQFAELGIYSSPDYPSLAAKILAGLRTGKLHLSDNLVRLYCDLKNGSNFLLIPPPDWSLSEVDARKQLTDAARGVMLVEGHGDAFFSNLVDLFRHDPHEPKTRAVLIKRQLDLPQKQIDDLLGKGIGNFPQAKKTILDRDFLPLLRKLVQPEIHDAYALAALATIAPEEARPLILEDLKRDQPIYVPTDFVGQGHDLIAVDALPREDAPLIEAILREKLAHPPKDERALENTMLLIERRGSKALLPDVIRTQEANRGTGAFHDAALRFWIRCDPDGGVEALKRKVHVDGKDEPGAYWNAFTFVLLRAWTDKALPFVIEATKSEHPSIILDAENLLEKHGGPAGIDALIAAIERLAAMPPPKDPEERKMLLAAPQSLTDSLVMGNAKKLTPAQLGRLHEIARANGFDDHLKELLKFPMPDLEPAAAPDGSALPLRSVE
jgi:hypothetical protein